MRTVRLGKETFVVKVVDDPVEYCRKVYGDNDEIVKAGDPLLGYICPKRKEIVIKRGPGKVMAGTLLHEVMHRVFWYLSEDTVCSAEADMIDMLWKNGWRPFS